MKVWIEVELNSNNWSDEYIAETTWLSFNSFNDLWIKMSREYYPSTIEYNFFPFSHKEERNKYKEYVKFLEEQRNVFDLGINWSAPSFVWTHIHFFDVRISKKRMLTAITNFILDNVDLLSRQSLFRLIFAHQLWGNYSHKYGHCWKYFIENACYSLSVNYNNLWQKDKYNPVINSREIIWGKPKSLEVRCIPNEFFFNWKLEEFVEWISSWNIFKDKRELNIDNFFKVLYIKCRKKQSLESNYANINSLYSSLLRDENGTITINNTLGGTF